MTAGTVQAKSQGNTDMIDRLDVRRRLIELQQRLVTELQAAAASAPVCPSPHPFSTAILSVVLPYHTPYAHCHSISLSRFQSNWYLTDVAIPAWTDLYSAVE